MSKSHASAATCVNKLNEWLLDSRGSETDSDSDTVIIRADYDSWLARCIEKKSITDCMML